LKLRESNTWDAKGGAWKWVLMPGDGYWCPWHGYWCLGKGFGAREWVLVPRDGYQCLGMCTGFLEVGAEVWE